MLSALYDSFKCHQIIAFAFQIINSTTVRRLCVQVGLANPNPHVNAIGTELKESDVPYHPKPFNTFPKQWLSFGIVPTITTNSKTQIYFMETDQWNEFHRVHKQTDFCPPEHCPEPKFIDCMPDYWRTKLNGILDLSEYRFNRRERWLLVFNNQSKPVFCIVDKDKKFTEGVRLEFNWIRYKS